MTRWNGFNRRALLKSAAIALATPALLRNTAHAATWEEVVAGARKEGELLMYSSRSDGDNKRLLDAFMARYPEIRASAIRLVGAGLTSRVEQEMASGALAASVVMASENIWFLGMAAKGQVVPPSGPSVALWKGNEAAYEKGVVTVASEPWVVGFNTQLVTQPPTDWDSLIDRQEFKGRVGLNEVNGFIAAAWYEFLTKLKPGFLEALAPLEPRLYPNSAPLSAGLGSGEIAWAPYSLPSSLEPLKRSGAPVDYIVPASGSWPIERVAIVPKDAPHPNAGLLLMEFMMSPEGQYILNGEKAGYTVAPGIEVRNEIEVDFDRVRTLDYASYDSDATIRDMRALVERLYRR